MPEGEKVAGIDDREAMSAAELEFYTSEVAPLLPPAVLDFHTHTWRASDWKATPWKANRPGGNYMVTNEDYPVDRLLADGRRAFPDREYRAVCFGYPVPAADNARDTAYVAAAATRPGVYPLMVTGADLGVPRETLAERLHQYAFLGYKVYLPWQGNDYGDETVESMLSSNEMDLANELGLVVLLHVPRAGRLADPVIQRGVQRLARNWPDTQIVLAHCGRCYLPAEMRQAIGALRDLSNVSMDTSMVMDPLVLQIAMETIGPSRLVYGSDFPVAAMRGRRVRVMDHWVDVVLDAYPQSACRVQSNDIHATYMAIEIAVAIRDAAERAGLSDEERTAIFFENGHALLRHVMDGEQIQRAEARWEEETTGDDELT